MAYTTPTAFNISEGFDEALVYVAQTVPFFSLIFLLTFFGIIAVGIGLGTRIFGRQTDILSSLVTAGYSTVILALLMSLKDGLIDSFTLTFFIILAFVLAGFHLLLKRT